MTRPSPGQIALALLIGLFLLLFLVLPVAQVVRVAFSGPGGTFTLVHFQDFFNTSLFRDSFYNSVHVALMSVVFASLIAVPIAYLTTRFHFRGAILVQTLGVLPLIMPPFVGAVAMQLIFGRSGSVNLLLDEWFGVSVDLMSGLSGVIFVESIHYFPFILLNLSAALSGIDRSLEESAENLGSRGLRLFRRIVLPLAMPGYLAGASLVFVKVFDDLGTPLILNVKDMLAPQAYLRITSVGLADPAGYVIAVIMVVFSMLAMWVAHLALKGKDYASEARGGGLGRRTLQPWQHRLATAFVVLVLMLVLAPHAGIFLLSIGTVWSYSVLPDAFTLAHYAAVFRESPQFVTNTVLYAGLAGLIDVVLGTAIAYLILRTGIKGRQVLDSVATAALAIPGLVLGIGYLRTFFRVEVPWSGESLAAFWFMIVVVYAVRRLPYALRACMAALHQVHRSLEEAAENLGAGRLETVRRVVVPLMSGGIAAGFVTSFVTAAVELSATLVIVASDADAPLSFGIYVYMQSAAGRGPGAALGVVAVALAGLGTYLSYRFAEARTRERSRIEVPA